MTAEKSADAKNGIHSLFIFLLVVLYQNLACASPEKYNSGWQLNIDNNLFQRYMKDRDYTTGLAFTVFGSRAQSGWLNIDPVRAWFFDPLLRHRKTALLYKNTVYNMALCCLHPMT